MTTQYAEEQGFKKKYLAPLIVLMLCAVSLTGAAYAYSTSISGNGEISGEYISIDMYDKDGKVLSGDIGSANIQVYTEKVVDAKYIAYVENETLVYTTYVKISSDMDSPAFTLKAAATYTAPSGAGKLCIETVAPSGASAGPVDLTSKEVKIYDATGATQITDNLSKDTLYKVVITLTLVDGAEFGQYDTVAEVATAVNAFDNTADEFTFKLTASLVE